MSGWCSRSWCSRTVAARCSCDGGQHRLVWAWGLDIPSNQGLEGALSVDALRVEYAARVRDVYDMARVFGRRHVTSLSIYTGEVMGNMARRGLVVDASGGWMGGLADWRAGVSLLYSQYKGRLQAVSDTQVQTGSVDGGGCNGGRWLPPCAYPPPGLLAMRRPAAGTSRRPGSLLASARVLLAGSRKTSPSPPSQDAQHSANCTWQAASG